MSKQHEQKERKNTYSQTSRLDNPKQLQLHHDHEKKPAFDCAVALCKMKNALLVISNLTWLVSTPAVAHIAAVVDSYGGEDQKELLE
jgi:hypothetical protein